MATPTSKPRVLMVTGAYYPELSGAGLQCRALVRQLQDHVDFVVLTTTIDPSLAAAETEDGVPIRRVLIDPTRWSSKLAAAWRMTGVFLRNGSRCSLVHLHGFSQKSILLVALAIVRGTPVALKLTSIGHDDPVSMRRRGGLMYWCYCRAAMFFAVSPGLADSYRAAGLPEGRLRRIPNGVDLSRFHPPAAGEREVLRRDLSIDGDGPVVLFVGFFSREKAPDILFDAWMKTARSSDENSTLVFVGATKSPYYEIDGRLAEDIRRRAGDAGLGHRVRFVESALDIERFYRVADLFVMPSVREGLPNALLEAMASGVACVATRLAGVTDSVIEDGRNGVLVPSGDVSALENAMRRLLQNPDERRRLGCEARRTIEAGYGLDRVADQYLAVYREIMGQPPCAA